MATLICNMDCIHKSKKPLRKWRYQNGARCYGCALKSVTINEIFDTEHYIETIAGRENMAHCTRYEPKTTDQGGTDNAEAEQ